jgi:hypothetical protein
MHFHPTQMLIVCLAGIGTSLAPGAPGAFALVTSTLAVQLIVFLWITCLSPSIDRIENAMQATRKCRYAHARNSSCIYPAFA